MGAPRTDLRGVLRRWGRLGLLGLAPVTPPWPCNDARARLRLPDAARGLAVYVLDDQVHLLRLADGRDTTIGPGTYARFMNAGLVYADGARIPCGARTRSSCSGKVVLVNEAAEQVAAVHLKSPRH